MAPGVRPPDSRKDPLERAMDGARVGGNAGVTHGVDGAETLRLGRYNTVVSLTNNVLPCSDRSPNSAVPLW